MYLFEKVQNFVMKRRIERLQAELSRQIGILDYIAMMTDVEIPVEEGSDYVV